MGDSVETGVEEQEGISFSWTITNLGTVLQANALINAQKIDFNTGEKFGEQAKWSVSLQEVFQYERRMIRFSYTLKEGSSTLGGNSHSQLCVGIKSSRQGFTVWNAESAVNPCTVNGTWSISGLIDIEEHIRVGRKLWNIEIRLDLYSPKVQTGRIGEVPPSLEQFQAKSTVKAREDLAVLLQNPVGGDVKIVSSDGREFSMQKGILAARSPVFDAMFRTDMTEAKEGIIKLPDISGATLETLLKFIYTGELLPQWEENGVIVELTNAAAKYQLSDLLDFLDLMLGRVCDLQNVGQLLTLANQLSLKTAEKELLKFISGKGTTSVENFFQIISGLDSLHI